MANIVPFKVLNGVKVEDINIIDPTGVWLGPQSTYVGPQGPQGASPAGAPGPAGFQGPRGVTGRQGSPGAQGAQGAAPAGPTGPAGFQGPQGVAGRQGSPGAQGARGASPTGPSGPAGFQGPQGVAGRQGSPGAQGAQGASPPGPTGPTGAPGPAASTTTTPQITSLALNAPVGPTGDIRATSSIIAYYSDQRLKTNIRVIENCLEKVQAMSGIYFKPNKVAEKYGYTSSEREIGLIAQQVKPAAPEIVKPAPFDTDAHGNSISGENYITVQYEKLVPIIVQAIKEQQVELKILLKKLEDRVS